ncbi:MAG TPA: aminomethyl-transferring glycine dehydrogenase subunit GcvPB [Candidatus Kapabacteria bacterium]|nr:aminomethyl-transferring glycine dehydrogenase subunit GcvPB [Candidatus Kapabacteria bacterium]
MEKLIFEISKKDRKGYTLPKLDVPDVDFSFSIDKSMLRDTPANLPEVSEVEVARHFNHLAHFNYGIDEGVYPLGSCTMKYNPKVNEKVASLDGFANIHPLLDDKYVQGALQLMYELGEQLKAITGMKGFTLQPPAGAAGELTGINLIRTYHQDKGNFNKKLILIPDSAHGTNPASASIGGFQIVNVKSNADGKVDIEDFKSKLNENVAGMMLTNPNTLGLFESNINIIQEELHKVDALLYMDGANMNALIGIVQPGKIGVDCLHLNLHKTFSTPHGGGGPGAGPVLVNEKLLQYLPVPQITFDGEKYALNYNIPKSIGKMHSFFGNFSIFVRAFAYILMLGADGIFETSKGAIINANYLKALIREDFDFPYPSASMHEFVMSGSRQKEMGASTMDIAKRLLDYGFHAPTVYFPLIVHEAMLVEPTETETKESLDAYAQALKSICEEIKTNLEIVKDAPHTTPIRRVNDVYAARNININWKE